jgi:kanamycin kinase
VVRTPGEPVELPTVLQDLQRKWQLEPGTPVWVNELGGLTFRLDVDGTTQYLKWSPHHEELDLEREARKLVWAGRHIRVPEVIEAGSDEHGMWLRTLGLPGESAVHPRWLAEPRTAARAIGVGLRTIHDRLPVADCPFSWSLETRFARIKRAADLRLIDEAPPVDRLVVCHGDACAPNTLIDDCGRFLAIVDLGRLGIGDRWADLAVATYSLGWNYTGRWEAELLDAYGIDRDDERIDYYRRLWDAT